MSKHTPGPWRTGSLVSWDARTGEPLAFVYRRPQNDPKETADNRICIRGGDDVDADARLIASAPDLLDALKLAHDHLAAVGTYETSEEIRTIRAALDRAEGDK